MGFTFDQNCNILCNAGFRHTGAKYINCTSSGSWTKTDPCDDVEAPIFTNGCPTNQHVFSGPLRVPVTVTWTDPVATDNSGGLVTLTSDPGKGSRVGPGVHTVWINATDTAGNVESCTFKVIIEVRECQPFSSPSNGQISCTAGHVEGSVCTVSCNHGYRLRGQRTLACLETETWSASYPSCEAVFCPAPPTVVHGQFSCPRGHQSPAECTLTCDSGYRGEGQMVVQCQENETWTAAGHCEDVQPPVFVNECPNNIALHAARFGQPTIANWTTPTVTDNSDDGIQLKSDATSGSSFGPGTTVVTYEATDVSGNKNTCYFNVTVTALQCGAPDLQPESAGGQSPMQDHCPNGHVYGAGCTLRCTQGYRLRLQGQDTITCERVHNTHPPIMMWRWIGSRKPQCKEDRCPVLTAPTNGALSCYFGDNGWECYLSCEKAWDVPQSTDGRFVCFKGQDFWVPASVPDCVARTVPGRVRILSDLLYYTGHCNESLEQLRHTFIAAIGQSVYNGACENTAGCVVENIEVVCSPVPTRSRRNTEFDDKLTSRLYRARRHAGFMTSQFVLVTFHVTIPYSEDSHTPEEAFKHYHTKAENFTGDLHLRARSGQLDVNDLDLVADESSVGHMLLTSDCPPGTVFRDTQPLSRFSCVAE
ncbi:P-selectin-like [Littorina saxatilis]|uniref:P-selectin-like n=1 Tax=Littorina saxatilis TaxID=31220 RepID=UPI0038B4E9A8